MTTEIQERLITDKEVGELIGTSTATVRRMVHAGHLPKPVKIGRLTRYRLLEILRFIESLEA